MNKELDTSLGVAISYGLAGGLLNSRRFRKIAKSAGFKTTSLNDADILVAHSAGCWLAPNDIKPKLVVYVGMPINTAKPSKLWRQANMASFRNTNLIKVIKYKLIGGIYLITQPARNWQIVKQPQIGKPMIYKNTPVVFISNHYDPWPKSGNIDSFVKQHNRWSFLSLPGSHDTIWEEPELFIGTIKVYATRLLAKTGSK